MLFFNPFRAFLKEFFRQNAAFLMKKVQNGNNSQHIFHFDCLKNASLGAQFPKEALSLLGFPIVNGQVFAIGGNAAVALAFQQGQQALDAAVFFCGVVIVQIQHDIVGA